MHPVDQHLHAGDVTVTVSPSNGGRVGQIMVGDTALLVDPTDRGPLLWGSYPMVPWAGRLRHGVFRFDGQTYRMPVDNIPGWTDPHAIHGTTVMREWTVVDASRDQIELDTSLGWALGGTAHQHIVLTDSELVCILGVRAGGHPMPAVVGWHPWFRKPLRAEFAFRGWYPRDEEYVADGRILPPPPPPWDDCFVDALATPTIWLPRRRGGELRVRVLSDCDHWVVYDMPSEATCVEPQSGPPDAFNLGLAARLEPGELLQRTMRIAWG
jgi:aldose 1-epimerase